MSERALTAFEVHQEEDDIASGRVVRVAIVGAMTGVLGVSLSAAILAASAGSLRPAVAGPGGPQASEAELWRAEQTPIRDTKRGLDLREAQRRELERWGWADRSSGVAIIPIRTAMRLVGEESR